MIISMLLDKIIPKLVYGLFFDSKFGLFLSIFEVLNFQIIKKQKYPVIQEVILVTCRNQALR